MSSIKHSKKLLNQTVNHLLEEAYDIQLEMPNLKEKSNAVIEEIVEFFDNSLAKLHGAKSKKDLAGFKEDVEQKGYDLYQDIMNLHV
jgi:ACT domain-containing protein